MFDVAQQTFALPLTEKAKYEQGDTGFSPGQVFFVVISTILLTSFMPGTKPRAPRLPTKRDYPIPSSS